MARLPFRSFPKAVEFNIETLFNQDGFTGFFCISPSTWELAYSLILGYGYWRSRYYFRDETTGELQDITDEEYTDITNIVDIAIEEFQMAGCTDLTEAVNNLTAQVGLINTNITNAGDCGCDGNSFDEGGLTDEDVENPGQDYLDDKCRVANVLHDRVRNFASTMDTIGVDNLLNLGVGFATSIIAGLVIAGPGGWATLLVIGVVSGILLLIVDLTAGQFGNLVTELDDNQDDLVCALFSASSADGARDAYLAVLDAQAVGEPEQAIVAFMLTNSVTNQLFAPTGSYVDGTDWLNDGFTPTDCSECEGCLSFSPETIFGSGGGAEGATVEDLGSGVYRLTSAGPLSDGTHRASIYFGWDASTDMPCEPPPIGRPTRVQTASLVSGTLANAGVSIWRIWRTPSAPELFYDSDTIPSPTIILGDEMGALVVTSTSAFVVDVTFTAFV